MQFLLGISVQCFVFSYLVAFALELSRPLMRLPARRSLTVAFTAAGLVAHIIYIVMHARQQLSLENVGLLASWYDWSLLVAWGLAAIYLVMLLQRPGANFGYFLLPPVLALIGIAWTQRNRRTFSSGEAVSSWLGVHSAAMLLGTLAVTLGLLAAIMFLVKSSQLKRKHVGSGTMRLPPLDWLQRLNRTCLVVGTVALAIGLFSGVIANLNRASHVGWTEGGVLLSGVLLLWLLAATAFEYFYKPARQGRKIAYLAVASFTFLVLAWVGVLLTPHGETGNGPAAEESAVVATAAREANA